MKSEVYRILEEFIEEYYDIEKYTIRSNSYVCQISWKKDDLIIKTEKKLKGILHGCKCHK